MKRSTLISIVIKAAIMSAVFILLDVDFSQLKGFFIDESNQIFLLILALLLVLSFLKRGKSKS